jgi:hypothetical protein
VGPRGSTNPDCKRLMVLGLFSPTAQCAWTGPPAGDPYPDHKNVLSTPLVVDFNFDDDPKTLTPSIVFVTYNCNDGGCGAQPGCYGVIRVIDGKTCTQQFSIASATDMMIGDVTPALGDLDGDGRAEIVTARQAGGIIAFRYDGVTKSWSPFFANYDTFDATGCHWDSVAIHDLDDDGVPEIVRNGPNPAVWDNHGVLLDGLATLTTTYSNMIHPVLADLDGDGAVEMVDGREMLRFDKTTRKWVAVNTTGNALGQVAVADFGTFGADPAQDNRAVLDGIPEIVVVSADLVRVQTLDGRVVFGPIALPGKGTGGAPTVADFDGDGRAEFGVAGADAYSVFDMDCDAGGTATTCPTGTTDGVLWSKASQDHSSNVTGSSVFDFEADGKAEVVYADECFSRVYDGRSGEVLFSQYHTSCTWYENPIVADVDGDLRSEVVIPSNANCSVACPALDPIHDGVRCDTTADCPGTTTCVREQDADKYGRCRCAAAADCGSDSLDCADPVAGPSPKGMVCRAVHPTGKPQTGVLVLSDVLDRWVGSRPIWNQHAYAVTNVNDDGTIPRTSQWKANWKDPKLNNFRMNVQGTLDPEKIPDLTGAAAAQPPDSPPSCDSNGTYSLKAKVCNRGIPVSFYKSSKKAGNLICTVDTTKTLNPGDCEVVGCAWKKAPPDSTDVIVSADDDGTGKGTRTECDEDNNLGTLRGVFCPTGPN